MNPNILSISRRRVAAFLISYSGLAWLMIQVADVVVPKVGLPSWIPTVTIAVAVLTLPLLLLAYVFALPQLSPAYIDKQTECVRAATKSILMSVHTLDPSSRDPKISLLQKSLGEAIGRGVDVRLMAPGGADRAQAAYELSVIHGVPVRILNVLEDQDLRFSLVDDRIVLFSHQPPGEKGFSKNFSIISSEALNGILNAHFSQLWGRHDAMTFEQYLQTLCRSIGRTITPASHQRFSDRLGIPVHVVRGILESSDAIALTSDANHP
jgi:hypothetical protein